MSKGVGKCRYGKWKERAVLGLVCHYQTKRHQAEHPQSPHHSIMALVLALLSNPTGPRNRHGKRALVSCGLPSFKVIWQGDVGSVCYVGTVVVSSVVGTSLSIIEVDGGWLVGLPLTNQVVEVMSGVVPELKRLRTWEDRLVHKIAYLNSRYEQSQLLNTKGNLPLTHLSCTY